MFLRRRPKTDPIEKQLRKVFPSDGNLPVGPYMTPQEVARRKSLPRRNAEAAQNHPLAQFETIEMMDDSHPAVLEFIKLLGYDPSTLEKCTIYVETNSLVKVEAVGFAVAGRSIGSTWKR
jgi:hypothetical protein